MKDISSKSKLFVLLIILGIIFAACGYTSFLIIYGILLDRLFTYLCENLDI